MAKGKAFTTGFSGPKEPEPRDVAQLGTQLAIIGGTWQGLGDKARSAVLAQLSGPAAVADTISEKIGNALAEPMMDAEAARQQIADKATASILADLQSPWVVAARTGFVPGGPLGSGYGATPPKRRRGRRRGQEGEDVPPGQQGPTGDPTGAPGEGGPQTTLGVDQATHALIGATVAGVLSSLGFGPPQPAGAGGGAVPLVGAALNGTSRLGPAASGGPVALSPPRVLSIPAPPPPTAPQATPGAANVNWLLGGAPLSPVPPSVALPSQLPSAQIVCRWGVLVDCANRTAEAYCLEDPRVPAMVAAGHFVPIRYSHDPHRELGPDYGSPELKLGWLADNEQRIQGWIDLACHAYANNGDKWPPGGDFDHDPPQTTPDNGLPVGDWPFDSSGVYHGG